MFCLIVLQIKDKPHDTLSVLCKVLSYQIVRANRLGPNMLNIDTGLCTS